MSYVSPVICKTKATSLTRPAAAARRAAEVLMRLVRSGLQGCSERIRMARTFAAVAALAILGAAPVWAQQPGPEAAAGEANLKVPDLSRFSFSGPMGTNF